MGASGEGQGNPGARGGQTTPKTFQNPGKTCENPFALALHLARLLTRAYLLVDPYDNVNKYVILGRIVQCKSNMCLLMFELL